MENKKYDLEKAKEDCRRHEDALEEAQSCMCGHCHECGFDPSEMKVGVHCENFSKRWHSPTIELMAARIKELEAEVEAKQANNEYLQKMTEEAQGIMQESQLLLCKEANEAEQLQNEVERLRAENKIISDRAAHHDRQDAKEIELLAARIAELEAGKLMYEEIAESYQIGVDDLRAYIKRLEAAFLGATKEIVYAIHEGRDAPEGEDVYAEKVAREALDVLRAMLAGGKRDA